MAEVGLDMAGQRSQPIDDFDLNAFDRVVTLSRQSTRFLPALRDPSRHRARPIPDPMSCEGTETEKTAAFAAGREAVRAIVEELLEELRTG
jgi:protein-tyrosine-phosphatase